ncbi:MAG: LytTR family DNA-binding domain-containing protein [Bacteroidota bacterium]
MAASLTAVIIDDLAGARKALRQDLKDYCPQVKIMAEAEGVVSGAKILRQHRPDLLFLDIQMQDGTGFDLLEIMAETPLRVIFTTAHDGFAIKAFRFAAVDYLLKPVDPDQLQQAVARAASMSVTSQEQLHTLLDNVQERKHAKLALHTMEKIHVVAVAEIIRCEYSANYTIFHLQDKRQLLVTKTLKEYDQLLSGQGFIRVHQSHLVNAEFIKEFVKGDGGYLVMKDGTEVPVSSRKRSQVMQMLGDL